MNIRVGDIVFAPYKEQMWPSKVVKLDVMAEIKFYRIKNCKASVKLPIKTLVPFSEANVKRYLETNRDKTFITAIK